MGLALLLTNKETDIKKKKSILIEKNWEMPELKYAQRMAALILPGGQVRMEMAQKSSPQAHRTGISGRWKAQAKGCG